MPTVTSCWCASTASVRRKAVTAGGWEEYLRSLAAFGMRPGLERVAALLHTLGDPQLTFRAIHVVGTNGKSSTTRYCEAILRAHGLRSGGYLSPHITGWAERVIVGGRAVAPEALGAAVERLRGETTRLPGGLGPATQFEVLTAAAFLVLAEAGVEAAVIEAGLGGRLDATNVLHARVVVLTNIGLEHTDVLGDTREAIFAEKAAVITAGADVVLGELDGLEALAEEVCRGIGARGRYLGRQVRVAGSPQRFSVTTERTAYERLSVPSEASYQVANAALAVAASELLLADLGRAADPEAVRAGLAAAAVPGRLQVVSRKPLLLADGAHNPHGVRALVATLRSLRLPHPAIGVLAVMRDKAVAEMLSELLPQLDEVVCTQASEPRSLTAGELAARVAGAGGRGNLGDARASARDAATADLAVHVEPDPHVAVAVARGRAGAAGCVLVTGSLYLLADLADLVAPGRLGRGEG